MAIEHGEPTIPVKYVDLSEEEEYRILLTYDPLTVMAQTNIVALRTLESSVRKNVEELNTLTDAQTKSFQETFTNLARSQETAGRAVTNAARLREVKEKMKEEGPHTLEGEKSTIPGALQPVMGITPELGLNFYDIPQVIPDLCVPCPEPISCWTTPDSPLETEFALTVLGNGNTRGLDWTKTVLCTHTADEFIEPLWYSPNEYAAKLLNKRVFATISPEFSVGTGWPKAARIHNTYRNRYLGRYYQECGINIIPSVSHLWYDGDENFLFLGLPKNLPCVSVQMQSHGVEDGTIDEAENIMMYNRSLNAIVKHLAPQSILVYGGPKRDEYVAGASLPKSVHIISIENFITKRETLATK
jgi:hypothetical protein